MKRFAPLIIIILLSFPVRFYRITTEVPFFGDMAWFYLSARDAVQTSKLPLLGITSSITWLHQGPLWTYLLIPTGPSLQFGVIFTSILGLLTIIMLYSFSSTLFGRKAGLFSAVVIAFAPHAVLHSRMAYHTSPIPLFMTIFGILMIKKRYLLSGLFLGFLYQLHLLTFILWPVAILLLPTKSKATLLFILGFSFGILPFLLSGPVQTLGVFAWVARRILVGASGITPFSESYLALFIAPVALLVGLVLSKMPKILTTSLLVLGGIGSTVAIIYYHYFLTPNHYGLSYAHRLGISRYVFTKSNTPTPKITLSGPGSQFASSTMPYNYLIWMLSRNTKLSGSYSHFTINESSSTVTVLK